MRWLWVLALAALPLQACGSANDGAVWSSRAVQQELTLSRIPDAQRVVSSHQLELQLADETLNNEQARFTSALQECPGQRRPLAISPSDKVRDAIRVRVGNDPQRLQRAADQAIADW